MSRPDSRELLPEIDVPTLVLVGADDTLTPPDLSQEMADEYPGRGTYRDQGLRTSLDNRAPASRQRRHTVLSRQGGRDSLTADGPQLPAQHFVNQADLVRIEPSVRVQECGDITTGYAIDQSVIPDLQAHACKSLGAGMADPAFALVDTAGLDLKREHLNQRGDFRLCRGAAVTAKEFGHGDGGLASHKLAVGLRNHRIAGKVTAMLRMAPRATVFVYGVRVDDLGEGNPVQEKIDRND